MAVVYCKNATDVSRTILWARQSSVRIAGPEWRPQLRGVLDDAGSRRRAVEARLDHRQRGIRDGRDRRRGEADGRLASSQPWRDVPAGSCPTVGIAGLALGGGVGFASRKLGLTCDNIRTFTMVTADGVLCPCNPQRNPDLFWACQGGGGGNFGVATTVHVPDPSREHGDDVAPGVPGRTRHRSRCVARGRRRRRTRFSMLAGEATESGGRMRVEAASSSGPPPSSRRTSRRSSRPAHAGDPRPPRDPYLDAVLLWAGCSDALHCSARGRRRPLDLRGQVGLVVTPLSSRRASTRCWRHRSTRSRAGGGVSPLRRVRRCDQPRPEGSHGIRPRDAFYSSQYIAGWNTAGATQPPPRDSWLRNTRAAMRPHARGWRTRTTSTPSFRAGATPTTGRTTPGYVASSAASTRRTCSASPRASFPLRADRRLAEAHGFGPPLLPIG